MNAIQPSRPPVQPRENRQVARRSKNNQSRRRHSYRGILLENTAKLCASTAIASLALYGLAQLLPYVWSQQQNSQEISREVQQTEGRVNNLRKDFSFYFDPHQTETIMKEQSNLLEPGQRQVFLQNNSKSETRN
jgi:hypothetical protein